MQNPVENMRQGQAFFRRRRRVRRRTGTLLRRARSNLPPSLRTGFQRKTRPTYAGRVFNFLKANSYKLKAFLTHHPFFCSVLGRRSRVVTRRRRLKFIWRTTSNRGETHFFVFPQKKGPTCSACARERAQRIK